MKACTVVFRGRDGEDHSVEVDRAASLYDGACIAIGKVALLHWYDPLAPLLVRAGEDEWSVEPKKLNKWYVAQQRGLTKTKRST